MLVYRLIPKKPRRCLKLLCGFAFLSLSNPYAHAKDIPASEQNTALEGLPPISDEEIQEDMKKYLGIRYRRAGASKTGFDCSGFVKVIYDEVFGVELPHQSSQQARSSELIDISLDSLRTGDLIFFSTEGRRKTINHVGIYLSEGRFIHAARSKGVVITELDNPYWRPKIVRTKRLGIRDAEEDFEPATAGLNLTLPLGRQSAFSFFYEKTERSPYSPSLLDNNLFYSFLGGEGHRMEVDYQSRVHASVSSRLTMFREDFFLPGQEEIFPPRPILGSPDLYDNRGVYAQGLRLASDIRPFPELSVTPSLSYLDYGPSINETGLPNLFLGLHVNLFSSLDGWSLSTSLRMPFPRNSSSLSSGSDDDESVDFSLAYRQRLSDQVHLSITGDRLMRYSPASKDSLSRFDTDDQQFRLMLHFFY